MENALKVSQIFEESSCCVCGRTGVDHYIGVADNYIKYGGNIVAFTEVINYTLNYEVISKNLS